MKLRNLASLLLLLIFIPSLCFAKDWRGLTPLHSTCEDVKRVQSSSKLNVGPEASWEATFFDALDERLKGVNLISLRKTLLPEHDLEVRFWYDARPEIINGFVIRRSGNKWSAIGIRQTANRKNSPVIQEVLVEPKSGWQKVWKRLVDAGILTLPDVSTEECRSVVLDGGAYVVETNVNRIYRTYRYSNPQFSKCDDAKRIVSIEKIIVSEFQLDNSPNLR